MNFSLIYLKSSPEVLPRFSQTFLDFFGYFSRNFSINFTYDFLLESLLRFFPKFLWFHKFIQGIVEIHQHLFILFIKNSSWDLSAENFQIIVLEIPATFRSRIHPLISLKSVRDVSHDSSKKGSYRNLSRKFGDIFLEISSSVLLIISSRILPSRRLFHKFLC